MLTTSECCRKLGVSRSTFLRMCRQYGIEPAAKQTDRGDYLWPDSTVRRYALKRSKKAKRARERAVIAKQANARIRMIQREIAPTIIQAAKADLGIEDESEMPEPDRRKVITILCSIISAWDKRDARRLKKLANDLDQQIKLLECEISRTTQIGPQNQRSGDEAEKSLGETGCAHQSH